MRGLPHQPLPGLRECHRPQPRCGTLTNPDVRAVGISVNTAALDDGRARALPRRASRPSSACRRRSDRAPASARIVDRSRAEPVGHARERLERFPIRRGRSRSRAAAATEAEVVRGRDRRRTARSRPRRVRALSALRRDVDGVARGDRGAGARLIAGGRPAPSCWRGCRRARRATRSTARCGISRRSATGMPVWSSPACRRRSRRDLPTR